jgi:four helix bundle protein
MQDFRNLKVWQKAHQLVLVTYQDTTGFPKGEQFGLTDQIRRAAVSIAANIAEGCGRGSDANFSRFLQMAMGSASEIEYEFLLAKDLEYITPDEFESITGSIREVK